MKQRISQIVEEGDIAKAENEVLSQAVKTLEQEVQLLGPKVRP